MTGIAEVRLHWNMRSGVDAALELPRALAELGVERPAFVVDPAVATQAAFARVAGLWRDAGVDPAAMRPSGGSEPDYDDVDGAADELRAAHADGVVAVGGGSTLDLGKGVGILLRNPGRAIDYRGLDRVPEPGLPVVCIPTTAGSGSEATATASFIDRGSMTKLGINGRHVSPALALLDPLLLVESPRSVTVGSGLDALVHAVEAVTARTANTISVLLGVEAVRLLSTGLPAAVERPDDVDARLATLLGAHVAAIAMQNAAGGPASGISYPLGVHHAVPHGYAGGVLLPHVVHANVRLGYVRGYATLAERLLLAPPHSDERAKAEAFADALVSLYDRLGAPPTLEAWGVRAAAVPELVELTVAQRAENLRLNPVEFGRDDVERLLLAVAKEG